MESIFSVKAKLSRNILLIHLIPLLSLGDPISDHSTLQPQEPQPFDSKPFQTTFITDTQLAQERTSRLKSRNRRSNKQRGGGTPDGKRKPSMSDTIKANIYADNSFILYINEKLVAVDSIEFIPHNVISVDILPEYPMTIAVMAKDNADHETGMEYTNNIGDGGFILKIGDYILSSREWKAKCFFHGPVNGSTINPQVVHTPIPPDWYSEDFDDSQWGQAKEYNEEEIGPKAPYFEHDFKGAKWIWSHSLKLDNTVIFRYTIDGPKSDFYTGR